jgi:hypothetical protein
VLQRAIEDLLMKYDVDLYLAGHDHNYRRTYPVYKNQVQQTYNNPTYPAYLVIGGAGETGCRRVTCQSSRTAGIGVTPCDTLLCITDPSCHHLLHLCVGVVVVGFVSLCIYLHCSTADPLFPSLCHLLHLRRCRRRRLRVTVVVVVVVVIGCVSLSSLSSSLRLLQAATR